MFKVFVIFYSRLVSLNGLDGWMDGWMASCDSMAPMRRAI